MSEEEGRKCDAPSVHPVGRWARWWLRADPWPLLALAPALALGYFWVYRSPVVAMVGLAYYHDFCLGSFLFGLLAAGRVVQLLVRGECELRFGVLSKALRSRRRFWPWLLGVAAGTFLMLDRQVPMHVSFRLSRPALDALADEALADPANAQRLAGRRAGLYRVAGAEVIGRTVVLYLDRDKGSYGFARVPGAASDTVFNVPGSDESPENHRDFPAHEGARDPVGMRVGGDWFVMYSGYWLVKVGWS